ncbi:MAG: hypothetical protein LBE12_10775 [Planctomycetaceae bacterium]|jgi:hypothetical protein|nr:hypothetical protein [Planctomycetaceae bacterium]
MKKITTTKRERMRRNGMVSIEYILTTGVVVPIFGLMLYVFWDSITTFYHFASVTINWPF